MGFIPTEEHFTSQGSYLDKNGKYNLKIVSVESAISDNGNPLKKVKFVCTESGKICNDTFYETKPAEWRIAVFAKACSIQIFKGQELDLNKTWIGMELDCEIELGEPNNKGHVYPEIVEFGPGKFNSVFKEGKAPAAPAQSDTNNDGDVNQWLM